MYSIPYPQKNGKALHYFKSPLGLLGRKDIFKESSSLEDIAVSSRKYDDPENMTKVKTRLTGGL